MAEFCYEGKLLHTAANRNALVSVAQLEEAAKQGTVLEGICHLCDVEHHLHVRLGQVENGRQACKGNCLHFQGG